MPPHELLTPTTSFDKDGNIKPEMMARNGRWNLSLLIKNMISLMLQKENVGCAFAGIELFAK